MADTKGNLRVLKPRKPEPNQDCISLLKAALEKAEAGEYDECAVIFTNSNNGSSDWETTGFDDTTLATAIGQLFVLSQYLSDCVLHSDDE